MRKFLFHTLSGLLFIFLVLTAWSSAATMTFSKPDHIKTWLSESKLYDNFVDNAIAQSQDPANGGSNSTIEGVPLSDPNVQQAAKAAFTPDTVQKAVDTFLDANYAWLQGKTASPEFSIVLAGEKAALATNLGNYAATRAATLPRCKTIAEVVQAAKDYLAATCIPVTVTSARIGDAVTEDVATSKDFLPNPIITPQTLGSATLKGDQQGTEPTQPYYQKLSSLPTAYRVITLFPWIMVALAILTSIGLIFLAPVRRRGLRRVATLLISAGAIVLLLILVFNMVFSHLENIVFAQKSLGQLQQPLVAVANKLQTAIVHIDLWFGIGFTVAGILLYIAFKYIRPNLGTAPDEKISERPGTPIPKT